MKAHSRHILPGRLLHILLLALLCAPSFIYADEVDDILNIKAKNQAKVKSFSAEYTVITHQPKDKLKNPKAIKMRYKVKIERLPKDKIKDSRNPWKMETEVIEPLQMKMKVEGDQAWFMDQRGNWTELTLTPELQAQFGQMSERSMGADPKEQREKFAIKIVRKNNPIFGTRTLTLEFKPRGKAVFFHRMEEDINNDGLPLETRLYDDNGTQTVKAKVRKHHKEKGVPVVDEMEAVSQTPAGEVESETVNTNITIEVNDTVGGVI